VIGLVIVAHEQIGREMFKAVEHVMGSQPLTGYLSISGDEDMDMIKESLAKLISRIDAGNGVLVFTDMFGGTPCNLALSFLSEGKIEVLSGLNLPMLIKAAALRQDVDDVGTLAKQVREAGRYHMHLASELMEKDKPVG
jgi:PTS system mannose-specific IIA component